MRYFAMLAAAGLVLAAAGTAGAKTVTFTAGDIESFMAAQGAPLSDASHQWGLWAVRAMPIVGGDGIYTITSGSTTQAGWGVSAPNGAFGAAPFSATNSAWFADASGSEAGATPSNPLYMIMDVPASNFWSYSYNAAGTWLGHYSPGGGGTFYASGYDAGAGGTNLVTAVNSSSTFSFDFTLDPGATWDGSWQFVVDGSQYARGTSAKPGEWEQDFFGGYDIGGGLGGGLPGNAGAGFAGPEIGGAGVPEPVTMAGVFLGVGSLVTYLRKRRAA
jgi:hypothetical protein